MQLEGKSALVTGGGRGIGRGIALAYAREGADVAIVGRSRPEPEVVAAEIRALGRKGVVITADLAQSSEAQRAVREAVQSLGKVDILVNNVGGYRLYTNNLAHHLPVAELSEEEWHRVITGNLTTAFLSCKAVLPHMMERRSGVIINLTSHRLAQRGVAGQAAYAAAKAAVERLTEFLAEELKEYGIAANILHPGWVLTKPNNDYDAEVHKRMRLPEDIGPAAVYLALQTPETLTGQVVSAPEFDEEQGIQPPSAYDRLYAS
jgi:3-oxoacyl-[acyl-carrier protein] reductase